MSRFTPASDGRAHGLRATIREMNRSIAKALLAITYPLRFTAHLTEPPARSRQRRSGP